MACLIVLIMNLHIPKYHIFLYFIKISKRPTLNGQCGLEGIVINFLLGINQFKIKLTSNSQYPSMLPSQEDWEPIDTTF